jgi:predicted RecA/RadA family phage recombinase
MAGLSTYANYQRVISERVGYAILQAGKQGYLTDTLVQNATSGQDLIDDVNAAVVAPGAESPAQRLSIARSIQEGINLGDLSTTRVQAATSVSDLAITYTWVSNDPAASNGHLGVNIFD